jgi:hypothetical protein
MVSCSLLPTSYGGAGDPSGDNLFDDAGVFEFAAIDRGTRRMFLDSECLPYPR